MWEIRWSCFISLRSLLEYSDPISSAHFERDQNRRTSANVPRDAKSMINSSRSLNLDKICCKLLLNDFVADKLWSRKLRIWSRIWWCTQFTWLESCEHSQDAPPDMPDLAGSRWMIKTLITKQLPSYLYHLSSQPSKAIFTTMSYLFFHCMTLKLTAI